MTETETQHLALIHEYLAALEAGAEGEALARFFTEDVIQIEWPNRLNPNGGQSDLATLLQRSAQVKHLLVKQTYQVTAELVQGDRVAIEAEWRATLAVPLGALAAGDEMNAYFAVFFEIRAGRIARQRNYDCFPPF